MNIEPDIFDTVQRRVFLSVEFWLIIRNLPQKGRPSIMRWRAGELESSTTVVPRTFLVAKLKEILRGSVGAKPAASELDGTYLESWPTLIDHLQLPSIFRSNLRSHLPFDAASLDVGPGRRFSAIPGVVGDSEI